MRIGNRELNDTELPYIAWEIGGTMGGQVSAMKLLQVASDSGAEAIKVQILDPERLVGGSPMVSYMDVNGDRQEEPQKDALLRRSLPWGAWLAFGQAAKELDLDLIATVDYQTSLVTAIAAGAKAIKICSGDITNIGWIRQVASQMRKGQPVILDTGHANLGELEQAIDTCLDAGAQVMVHHVAGGYPAGPGRVHLKGLPVLKKMFPEVAIGYSSHVASWTVDAAAIALGAVMVEKNLTLSRDHAGPEQSTAVEPQEAYTFCERMREVYHSLGTPRKRILEQERRGRAAARRSAWLRLPQQAGTVIELHHLEYRRPAIEGGFEPPEEGHLIGRALRIDLPVGPILRSDLL